MSTEKPCQFCYTDAKEELAERLITETEQFYVIPTFGQIVEGYVLIVPKRHAACLGALTDEELSEYGVLHGRVRDAVADAYGREPIAFEHGVVGQTLSHAHMHLAPPPNGEELVERISPDRTIANFAMLRAVYFQRGKYLFYESADTRKHIVYVGDEIPPQYLRIQFAESVGHPERANWRTMDQELDSAMRLNTGNKLRALLA